MRLLLLKPLFSKKLFPLLRKSVRKVSQKINLFDLLLFLPPLNKNVFLSAKKCVLLSNKWNKNLCLLLSEKIKNKKITSTKKIIYSF